MSARGFNRIEGWPSWGEIRLWAHLAAMPFRRHSPHSCRHWSNRPRPALNGYTRSSTTGIALALASSADAILRYSHHFERDGAEVLREACRMGLEGIVSKRRDLPYEPGRSRNWLKTKCVKRQEFVIGGFTEPEGSRTGIGALLVGVNDRGNLRFTGKVGTGFTVDVLTGLRSRLNRLKQKDCPFALRPAGWLGRNAHWVIP